MEQDKTHKQKDPQCKWENSKIKMPKPNQKHEPAQTCMCTEIQFSLCLPAFPG